MKCINGKPKQRRNIMAKRFTDTEKWRDEWFGSLPNDYRIIWQYLTDTCTPAGIWKKDLRGLNFNCNVTVDEIKLKEIFSDRLIDCGKFFFIPKFLRFQYKKGLNSNKPAIISVRDELIENNLIQMVHQSLGNDFLIIKDKDKDKDKVKDMDKNKDKEKYITVENEKVSNPLILLQTYEPALNARQKEHNCKNWRLVLNEWFEQNLEMDFNDKRHVFNSFSKYLISPRGKPNNGAPVKPIAKIDAEFLKP